MVINNHQRYGWDMFTLDEETLLSLRPQAMEETSGAAVRLLSFDVDEPADTFLDMSACGKGTVFLNGFCLGRFWDIGPQKRLYIPAPLLRAGRNELLIVETEGRFGTVALMDEPELG